jgi:hypothetical protein
MTRYSGEERAKHLENWHGSGKKAWAYAKENGINPQTFTKWTKWKEAPGFVELRPALTETAAARKEIVIEKGDMKIRLPSDWCARELCTVLERLGVHV